MTDLDRILGAAHAVAAALPSSPTLPTLTMPIVGLGHKARQGKDVVAARLARNITAAGRRPLVLPFAAPLKYFCRILGMTTKDGALLQHIGTDILRTKEPGIWFRSWAWTVDEERPDVVIVPDVRFPNEADFLLGLGARLVKVTRLEPDGRPYRAPDRPADHPSEVGLDGYQGWTDQVAAASGDTRALERFADLLFLGLWPLKKAS